jgi:hypothetical protein
MADSGETGTDKQVEPEPAPASDVIGLRFDTDHDISKYWQVRFGLEVQRCNGQFGQPGGVEVEEITSNNYYMLELPRLLRSSMREYLEETMKKYYEYNFERKIPWCEIEVLRK